MKRQIKEEKMPLSQQPNTDHATANKLDTKTEELEKSAVSSGATVVNCTCSPSTKRMRRYVIQKFALFSVASCQGNEGGSHQEAKRHFPSRYPSFRKRRLTKAFHNEAEIGEDFQSNMEKRGVAVGQGDVVTEPLSESISESEAEVEPVSESDAVAEAIKTSRDNCKGVKDDVINERASFTGQRRIRQSDAFHFAGEIEGLDEEDEKHNVMHRHSPKHEQNGHHSGTNRLNTSSLPFSSYLVGTFSCHGIEPLPLRRFVGELKEDRLGFMFNHLVVAKINQDCGGIAHPYGNDKRTALFGAFDGHGLHGEDVARYAMHETMSRLKSHPDFRTNVKNAFRDVFIEMDEALDSNNDIDAQFSGSTACVMLMRDDLLYVSNVGDSRAVLSKKKRGLRSAVDLTRDHSPDIPEERDRIVRCGGFISVAPSTVSNEDGAPNVTRVWLDADHTKLGLAMSRSVGDRALKNVGLTALPEVRTHLLTEDDEFVILATDGVWEFITSDEAVEIVGECLDDEMGASMACEILIEEAASRWRENEGDYRDDITAIVVTVKDLWEEDDRCESSSSGGRET